MRKKTKNTKKEEKSIIKPKVQIIEAEVNDYASIEKIEALFRLYFKRMANTVSIYFRPTHEYLGSVVLDDKGIEEIKRLTLMPRYEFYSYIFNKNIRMPEQNSTILSLDLNSLKERESWFNEAWKMQTTYLLSEIGIDVEKNYESPPYVYIKETLYKTKRRTY